MGIDVLTNRYHNARTGANLNETLLNQSNVNVNDFGKLFARGVDGQIYAQPLIVSDLEIPELGKRSIVIVATTRNMVYAFDAENAEACHPIWRACGTWARICDDDPPAAAQRHCKATRERRYGLLFQRPDALSEGGLLDPE